MSELTKPAVSMSEAQSYVRIETGEEEALLAGLVRTASALCESFLGQAVIERQFSEWLGGTREWQRLNVSPVRSIIAVESVEAGGIIVPVDPAAFAVDIDAAGDGWIRLTQATSGGRLRVTGTAGMASSFNEVPEPVRQGVLRLVAHLFTARDGTGGEPPAAVTALWRPYRRIRLA